MQVTADIVLFTIHERKLHVLLIRRAAEPFAGQFALPGGFVLEQESVEQTATRELREETGLEKVYLEQLYTFGEPDRDPRGRIITVAYFALVARPSPVQGGSDASEADWFPVDSLPTLAFDHLRITEFALERLRNKLDWSNVGFGLLPEKFTLPELQAVHEAILGQELDKRNFRRKILQQGIVRPLKEMRHTGRKPAVLYRFGAEK